MIVLSVGIILVLGIKDDVAFMKVGIARSFVSLEEIEGFLVLLVLWMLITHWFEKSVEIFLPQPCRIKQDSLYLLVRLSVLQTLVLKYLQA